MSKLFWVGMGVDVATGKMWKYDLHVAVPVNKKDECKSNRKIFYFPSEKKIFCSSAGPLGA